MCNMTDCQGSLPAREPGGWFVPRAGVGRVREMQDPTSRRSGELFRKAVDLYDALGRLLPAESRTARRLELANGSRVLSLPGTEKTLRAFSGVALLVID